MIPVGKRGIIKKGPDAGHFIYVEDNLMGGFLIHTSPDADFQRGMDGWVDKEDLDQYFNEAGWEIDWLEDDGHGSSFRI
jgi:hypothetical protein